MVLQSSGAISLNDIQNEFGGTNPIGINEYYSAASGIPSSGLISFNQFYGKSAVPPWEIIMHTSGYAVNSSVFGSLGTTTFKSITASSTGASSRTSFGNGTGLYNAFFTKKNITKIALVSGNGSLSDPTSHSYYVIYDLVGSTGNESLYEIINRLDTYNLNSASWAGNDGLYGSPSVTNFTAGSSGYSGLASSSSYNFTAYGGAFPDKFCIWGVNRDSDNDTQVLCAFSGNLQTGKGDAWRGASASQSFWSYWGNDWHSNTQNQTISRGAQTYTGLINGATNIGNVYLMAF